MHKSAEFLFVDKPFAAAATSAWQSHYVVKVRRARRPIRLKSVQNRVQAMQFRAFVVPHHCRSVPSRAPAMPRAPHANRSFWAASDLH